MLRCALLLLLSLVVRVVCAADADSLRICQLLADGIRQPSATNLMLYYGHRFLGTPYVAATLDRDSVERLVVNVREMDCTTFVETVVALTLTTQQRSVRYADYCTNLQRVRYADGRIEDYASRNHYFSQWITNAERQGLAREIRGDSAQAFRPFTRQQTLRLHYMSQHPDAYPMMRGRRQRLQQIQAMEQQASGAVVRYIPAESLGLARKELACVHDGDILAIVTKKDGLDTTHIGLAEWGSDGLLHLLNASSIHHKVVLEAMTLRQYMSRHPSQLGVRVVRVHGNQ